jgi:hypothetical protein
MLRKDLYSHSWLMESRYFRLAIVILFVILSAVAFSIDRQYYLAGKALILKEDREAAHLLSLILDQRLKRIVAVMEAYSYRPLLLDAVRDKNLEQAKAHLISMKKNDPIIDSLIITDRQGGVDSHIIWT